MSAILLVEQSQVLQDVKNIHGTYYSVEFFVESVSNLNLFEAFVGELVKLPFDSSIAPKIEDPLEAVAPKRIERERLPDTPFLSNCF